MKHRMEFVGIDDDGAMVFKDHHRLCRGSYITQVGVTVSCPCPSHSRSNGDPSTGAVELHQRNSAPGGATNTVAPGASPTNKESTSA